MREDIYTILEKCLSMLDQGSDLESCLARYPEYASELRPLLMASVDAESLSLKEIPVDVVRRSKSKVLNIAAEMREQKSAKKKTFFVLPVKRVFRFSLAALITLLMLVGVGGTGLVRASSTSLPGDQFYPVKLTWENLLLKLAASQIEREALEDRFEMERVEEIEGLFSSNRSEEVKFSGQVDGIFPDQISVSSVLVVITPETRVEGQISMNAWVRVEGETTPEGMVIAEKIKVESAQSEEGKNTDQDSSDSTPVSGEDSGKGNGKSGDDDHESTSSPEIDENATRDVGNDDNGGSDNSGSETNQPNPQEKDFEIEGVVSSYNGSSISVNNRIIFIIPETELRGSPTPGSRVSIRGYVYEEGVLIALRIDVKSNPKGGSGDGGGEDSGGSDDDDDDHPTKAPGPDETLDD